MDSRSILFLGNAKGLQQKTERGDPKIVRPSSRPKIGSRPAATETLQSQPPTPGIERESKSTGNRGAVLLRYRRASSCRRRAPPPVLPSVAVRPSVVTIAIPSSSHPFVAVLPSATSDAIPSSSRPAAADGNRGTPSFFATIRMEYGQHRDDDFQELADQNDGTFSYDISIDDIDNGTTAQYNIMYEGNTSIGAPQFHLVDESVLPSMRQEKEAKQKNIARRGFAFSKEEDSVLCAAYLNISKDATVGVNQNLGTYWKRIYDYYSEYKPKGSARSQIGLQKRWKAIQTAVSKFSALKSKVDRRNESGKNEYDRIEDAVKLYEDKEPFHFMHCWKILRYEAKWNDRLLEINSTPSVRKVPAASDPIVTQTANDPVVNQSATDPIERPEGRDSAKRRRVKEDSASSNAAVEVLQQIHQRNELTEVKQEAQMQEILTLKGDKMKITQKMFDLQKHEFEVRNKYKEEQLNLAKKDIEVRAKQSEAQLLTAELGIMGADLDKLSPQVRSYYITMQQEIMKRRGIDTSQNLDGA